MEIIEYIGLFGIPPLLKLLFVTWLQMHIHKWNGTPKEISILINIFPSFPLFELRDRNNVLHLC